MNLAWHLIDQLVCQGIRHFCIAPGSRSTPLVLAAAHHPKATSTVHFDERGLAFYALGYGKATKKPAAIITTSGSAVGNLLPAVMEAFHSHTPLILLTADRPKELHACGANQTTRQAHLFDPFCLYSDDLPPHAKQAHLRSVAAHVSLFQEGPVHLNCQFEEPFTHVFDASQGRPIEQKRGILQSPSYTTAAKKGIILIGEIPCSVAPILSLAKRLQWPVFADILSNARCMPTSEQIDLYPYLLKDKKFPEPEFILHFGERLVTKHAPTPTLHVSSYSSLQDPKRSGVQRVIADIESFCNHFEAGSDPSWLSAWQALNTEAKQILSVERSIFKDFSSPDQLFFLGNSLPIREAQLYLFPPAAKGFYCNRGLSGIDGNIATAVGLAHALKSPLIACLGDQTTLHDLNSLSLLKKSAYPITLVICNNFGGKIFSYLPIKTSPYAPSHFEAQHALTFEYAAKLFDIPYSNTFEQSSRSQIIEMRTAEPLLVF